MYGLKFYTSGLAFKDENSDVIGFEINKVSGTQKVWLQPKETTKFQAETMEEYNKITIAELKDVGLSREQGIKLLVKTLISGETCVCWFYEFIAACVKKLTTEIEHSNDFNFSCRDLLPLVKEAMPDRSSYRLRDIMEELEVNNLVNLFDKLCALNTYKGVKRV